MTWSEAFVSYIRERFGEDAQKQAALSLEVAPSSVSNWCRGTVPREDMRKRISKWSRGRVPHVLHVKAA